MDPNVTLMNIRAILATSETRELSGDLVQELIEHVEALDEWITKGGFLPAEWVTVPATAYDIATHMPVHAETLAASSRKVTDEEIAAALAPVGWDPHAAFAENELGGA